ncbi:hypothetical protein [Viscerimonas tarda]
MKSFDIDVLNGYTVNSDICCEKHPEANLLLYGYYSNDNRSGIAWNNINVHCRGLILDINGNVIEHPFVKFWMFKQYLSEKTILMNDNQIFRVPDCSFRILEKIDGTMVILYWINNNPYLATQRSFTNVRAKIATEILYEKYSDIFNKLNRNYTYVFEAVYPETKVLIDYGDMRDLFLIGMIDKDNGKLLPLDNIGFPLAHDYTSEYGHIKNFNSLMELNLPNKEGFVIQYDNGDLIKIKFPWYLEAHRLLDFFIAHSKKYYINRLKMSDIIKKEIPIKDVSTMDVWNALRAGDKDLISITKNLCDIYFSMGLDYWLMSEKEKLLNQFRKYQNKNHNLNGSEIWENIKPDNIHSFDLEKRLQCPHIFETTMWNWEKRFLR